MAGFDIGGLIESGSWGGGGWGVGGVSGWVNTNGRRAELFGFGSKNRRVFRKRGEGGQTKQRTWMDHLGVGGV